jgi:hypothetical protein
MHDGCNIFRPIGFDWHQNIFEPVTFNPSLEDKSIDKTTRRHDLGVCLASSPFSHSKTEGRMYQYSLESNYVEAQQQ